MINISFHDLSYEKQEEIREMVKEEVMADLQQEASENKMSIEELLVKKYDVGSDWETKEEKEKWLAVDIRDFIDELVSEKLKNWDCEATWRI
jgi:hypothetical protein